MLKIIIAMMVTPSQSLLAPNHHHHSQYRSRTKEQSRQIIIPTCTQSSSSSTALNMFFDNFLHPYGVTSKNQTNYPEEENHLLSLLLPKYRSREELRSRSKEEFQRRRLERQLKTENKNGEDDDDSNSNNNNNGKNNKRKKINKKKVFLADDDNMVKEVADMFQNKRLEEQSKLRNQQRQQQTTLSSGGGENNQQFLIKSEAFQRALLEERLRLTQQQQQQQQQQVKSKQDEFVIDMKALEQDKKDILNLIENSSSSSSDTTTTTTTSSVDSDNGNEEMEAGPLDNDDSDDNVTSSKSSDNDGGSYDNVPPPLNNDTAMLTAEDHDEEGGNSNNNAGRDDEESASTKATTTITALDLNTQLKSLHEMVALATVPVPTPPSNCTAITLLLSNNNDIDRASTQTTRLQRFLATTHLPLPPDERTPMASLVLAPLAHIASSIFLSMAMVFYATFAILDILLNDGNEEYCTKTCIRKAVSIWKSCLQYLFTRETNVQEQHRRGVVFRTLQASQTSLLALFFTCQCVIVRAATRTKFSAESSDAGVASIRYLIYAMRSLNILRQRAGSSLQRTIGNIRSIPSNPTIKKKRRKLHLLRVLSNIRTTAARRLDHQRSLLIKQQRMRSEKEFQDKIQSLNEDILKVEREKKQLDIDRANLLNEGVGVVAWYSMTKEASDALATEREELEKERKKMKGGKRHWRPRFGYWGGSSRKDEPSANDDESVDMDENVTKSDDSIL